MKREAKKQATRDRIVQAALELFAEQGYDAATVAQITDRAGVAKGTFFNYFQTKEEVALEIGDAQVAWAVPQIQAMLAEPGLIAPRILKLMVGMGERVASAPGLIRALAQAVFANPGRSKTETERGQAIVAALAPLVARAQASGEFRAHVPPQVLAALMMQTYMGVLQSWSLMPEAAPLPQLLALTFDAMLHGIVVRP